MYASPEYVFSNCRILYSIDYLLSDMNGILYFRQFLSMQTQGIELLLFWIEVEIYKDSNDRSMYTQALRIFDKFIQNGAEYKIEESIVDQSICYQIAAQLGREWKYENLTASSSNGAGAKNAYAFPISKTGELRNVFDEAQGKCYELLKSEYFPQFLAHKSCDALLNKLKIEERFYDALKRSHMIA